MLTPQQLELVSDEYYASINRFDIIKRFKELYLSICIYATITS